MIQDAINKIKREITLNTSINMTMEQESYVVGLADALQIIEEEVNGGYIIGKKYYCLMINNFIPLVEEMYLYRINKKTKYAYCFSRNIENPTPDLVLYSDGGLKLKVFNTIEEAHNHLNDNIFFRRKQ